MDLSVSPDLEAYLSYVIVVVLGATTATVQVSRRLGDIDGIWLISRTWLLFAAYLLVPVGLFWLLDRTGAITDTSFFAAVLIGVGYDRILSGSSQALRAPGELSQFWNPFLAYADKVSKMALQQSAKHQMRLVERVLASIAQDGPRYEAMQSLAIRFSPDAEALRKQLAAIDATSPPRGPSDVLEEKTRLLYSLLVTVPDAHFLMKSKKIIPSDVYWLEVRHIRSIVRWLGATGVTVALIIVGINSVDTRSRINEVLKFLAKGCPTNFAEGTPPWTPSDGDSTARLEARVKAWTEYWENVCQSRPG